MESVPNKILIIENDPSLCGLLQTIMEKRYQVAAFTSSLEAWSWLSAGNLPDLIITDFKMPYVDGLELIETIKTSGLYQDIPVIVITGIQHPEVTEKCKHWDINDIILKPFNPDDLMEIIENTLKIKNHV